MTRGRGGMAAGLFFIALMAAWWWGPPRDRSGPLEQTVAVGATVRLFALGDAGTGEQDQLAVAAAMEARCQQTDVTGLLLLGDNIYPDGVDSVDDPQWVDKVERPYGSPCLARLPIYAVLGNHDRRGDANAQIRYGLSHPRWVMPARFYAVNFGSVLQVVALDSEFFDVCGLPSVCVFDFLRAMLRAASGTRWRLVMAHRPVTSATTRTGDYLTNVLGAIMRPTVCAGADLYLSGHDHHLEHRQLPGCRTEFVVAGGGGGHVYPVHPDQPETRYVASAHGFTELVFDATHASLTFWSAAGTRLYGYTLPP